MAHAALMEPPAAAERGSGVYNEKLGMWVFLGSEIMFFTALIGSYIILRVGAPGPWALPDKVLAVPVTAVNTFLLICSSVSMVKAYASIVDGDQQKLRFWLLMTIIGGAGFVSIQGYEYFHLIEHGFLPSGYRPGSELAELATQAGSGVYAITGGIYGSTFYAMTGFHGFHVTCGVISMIWVYFKARRGGYSATDYRGVEVIGLYWHFVDLVWIVLFTIVYLV